MNTALLLTLATMLAGHGAFAQQPGSAIGGNCTNKKLSELCGGSPMGSPEFSACAASRLGEASTACQTIRPEIPATEKRAFDPKSPCAEDRRRLCPWVPDASPEALNCLLSHRKEVTPACAAGFPQDAPQHPVIAPPKPPAHFHQEFIVGRCLDEDIQAFCPDKKGLAINACLEAHEAEVSKRCKIRIADTKLKRRASIACKADIAKSCDDTKTFDDAITCLHRAERVEGAVSAACKTALLPRQDD
jgi:hypothetical protein